MKNADSKPLVILLLATLILYLPILINPNVFLERGNDLTEFFWPIYSFTKEQILTTHRLPFWNNLFLSGTPLLPDPQAPIFYLPNLIFLILPLRLAFITSSILHTFVGALGAYLVAKKGLKLTNKISLFTGIAYLLSPRLSAFIEAGHFGLIMATAWLPFVILSVLFLIKRPEIKWSVVLSLSLAGTFFTHPTTVVLLTAITTVIFFVQLILEKEANKLKSIKHFLAGGALAFGLTAITLLPQLEWIPNTSRYLLTANREVWPKWNSKTEFVKSATNPLIFGKDFVQALNTEKWIAVGTILIILSLFSFLTLKIKNKIILAILLSFILIISSSNTSPFSNLLLSQDWYVFARVTTRSWFAITLTLTFLSAIGLSKIKSNKLQAVVSVILLSELLIISWTKILKPVNNDRQISPRSVYEFLSEDPGRFRVFCTTRCFSQKDVAEYGIETVGGYSTLHQKNYYEHAWQMTGTYWNYYTLALPPIGSYKNGKLNPDFVSLGKYNTKYIISPYKLDHPYARLIKKIDTFLIYKNEAFYPRAYYKSGDEALINYYSPNKIIVEVHVGKEDQLIISEVYNAGWNAYLNGSEKVEILETPNALRAINLKKNTEYVILKYEPISYLVGKVITLTTVFFLLVLILKTNQGVVKPLTNVVQSSNTLLTAFKNSLEKGKKTLFFINRSGQSNKNLLLILSGILIAFALLELSLRTYHLLSKNRLFGFDPGKTSIEWVDNNVVGRRLAPNQEGWFVTPSKEYTTWIEVNSRGWRDSEHSFEKPNKVYRILIIGDSFVENFQVPLEKTFFKKLEKKINQNSGLQVGQMGEYEVVALGLGDTGTAQQYLVLKEWGLKYDPDLVIHFFFTGNDIKNNSFKLMGDPHRPYFDFINGKLKLLPFEVRSSKLVGNVKSHLKKNVRLIELILAFRSKIANQKSITDYPVDYHVYDKKYSKEYQQAWEITKNLILKTKNLSEKSQADYLLVSLANNEQVNENVWGELLNTYPAMKTASLDRQKPDKVLKEFCEKENLNCYFMLPFFRNFVSENPELTTHYRFDGHWNETGTNLVTEFLLSKLTNIVNKNFISNLEPE